MNAGTHGAGDASSWRRPVPHPLLATRIGNLLACFRRYGWPELRFRYWFRALNLLSVCALRTPLHHLERWRVRDRVEPQPLTPPPVFIIGHWRSGTTHLHQLLSQDQQFGVVTLMQAAFPLDFLTAIGTPLFRALLPRQRMIDAVALTIDSPWEEEMAMACFGTHSFFHAFFFPRKVRQICRETLHFEDVAPERIEAWWRDYRYFLKKVQCARPGRRLLLKNPANSARVTALRERFPGAKFIHIHRHPEEVYASTLFMHRRLQELWALQGSDLTRLPNTLLDTYAELMTACFAQTGSLPGSELCEVRMTDLERQPLATVETIYRQLELPGFDAAQRNFATYLEKIGTFPKNRLGLSAEERRAVRQRLAHIYERWGYRSQ